MTRMKAVAAAAVTAATLLALLSLGTRADGRFTREPNIDRSGNDISVTPLPLGADPAACEAKCAATQGCVAFTFVKKSTTVPAPLCRIKNAAPYGHESHCCISGALVK